MLSLNINHHLFHIYLLFQKHFLCPLCKVEHTIDVVLACHAHKGGGTGTLCGADADTAILTRRLTHR